MGGWPKVETGCANCGHPYVRHAAAKGVMAGYRKYLGCRDCACEQFEMPDVIPEDFSSPAAILGDICANAMART